MTICARGGSKGIPGKNVKLINGKPLIYYSIKMANKFAENFNDVNIILSTDDDEIKNIVKGLNLNIDTTYNRPKHLATDSAGKMVAIIDVKEYCEEKYNLNYDFVMDLDVTSPLRTLEDLRNAFELLLSDKNAFNIFSVSPANRNPYFNMVEQNSNGYYTTSKKGEFLTRQSTPKVFDMNASFYIFSRKYFANGFKGAITDKSLIYEVPHICFDLDHPLDFDFMEYLMLNNKLDFEIE